MLKLNRTVANDILMSMVLQNRLVVSDDKYVLNNFNNLSCQTEVLLFKTIAYVAKTHDMVDFCEQITSCFIYVTSRCGCTELLTAYIQILGNYLLVFFLLLL